MFKYWCFFMAICIPLWAADSPRIISLDQELTEVEWEELANFYQGTLVRILDGQHALLILRTEDFLPFRKTQIISSTIACGNSKTVFKNGSINARDVCYDLTDTCSGDGSTVTQCWTVTHGSVLNIDCPDGDKGECTYKRVFISIINPGE